ncbi:MAG: CHAP domain-containing protein, partial [Acidimicrobiales bacterium]
MSPVTGITATPDGRGYWLLQPDDWNYAFSDSPPYATSVSSRVVSVAAAQVEGDPVVGQGAFCNPYGPCEPWCALFVTWVWNQVGIPVPSYPFTGSIFGWAAAHGELLAADALAAPGDAVLYGTGPQNAATSVHTGIVVQVWPDGAVITVEGDAGPAPSGLLSVVVNGPFLPSNSSQYNGAPVYAFAQPVP